MTYLVRSHKSFTLLELMIAFVIMAILSAVAIPSLINVANNDRTSADQTSAIALADASYYGAVAKDTTGTGTLQVNYLKEADQTTNIPFTSGGLSCIESAPDPLCGTPWVLGDGTAYYVFGDPVIVELNVATTTGGPLPSLVTDTTTTTGATTTTIAPTTTTTLLGFVDTATCSITVTGTLAALPGYNDTNGYSLTCSGVTGPELDSTILVNGTYFDIVTESYGFDVTDAYPGPYTSLPSSFTVNYTGAGSYQEAGPGASTVNTSAIGVIGTDGTEGWPTAGTVGLYDSSDNSLACYTPGCGTIDSSSVTAGPPETTTTTTATTLPPIVVTGTHVSGEPDCTVTTNGPFVSGPVAGDWSVACTGVVADTMAVEIPVPGGIFIWIVQSADIHYSGGPTWAALPSSFTANQASVSAADDSTPSALYFGTPFFDAAGSNAPQPDYSVGQGTMTLGPGIVWDSCVSAGTGCGQPSYTATGF